MKPRIFNIVLILTVIFSMLALEIVLPVIPVQAAEDPFPLPDMDADGLENDLETAGWYNLSGGPFVTDPEDMDSDNDGLSDGEEKLFDTNPLDSHDPGIAVIYNNSFKTKEYFSTTDPKYIKMIQAGDQYLLREALVVRRGTTFNIAGPASGTLTLTGTGMTTLTPTKDPRGGWAVSMPITGTVGTYIATVIDGAWSKSMPVYVIFELLTTLPEDQIAAFLYDGDPDNKKDEVAVWWRMWEYPYYGDFQTTVQPCPGTDPNAPCSLWQYHNSVGYAQAYWTEQFTKSVFVDNAIKAMQGKNTMAAAVNSIASWTDTEFRTRHGSMKNSWSTAMYRWFDGTGITMEGGYCETTATTFTSILRSAGIAARPFTLDYNKTSGHGESGQIGTGYEYDHSVMMWMDNKWYAKRAYGGDESGDLYYPWASGTTGTSTLDTWDTYSGYYNDYYGDGVFAVNEDWTFQISTGVGTVNTAWENGGPSDTSFDRLNRDYEWRSDKPLEIKQSPHVDVLNYMMWNGDNWAPSEWRAPIISNPASPARDESMTYYLPAGVPDPANPLENWPYNPRPTSCSPSTPTDECNAFMAAWNATANPIVQGQALNAVEVDTTYKTYLPIVTNGTSSSGKAQLGNIQAELGLDNNKDGLFEELNITVEVTASQAGKYQLGGLLLAGENVIRTSTGQISLKKGLQTVQLSFDGQQIGDFGVDGPYQVQALWVALPDQPILTIIEPEKMLDYQEYTYSTKAYSASQFKVWAATIVDEYTYQGVNSNGNGLYEAILVNIPLKINLPGIFTVEGDLYDGQGNFVEHATWTGSEPTAVLQFDVALTQPPYSLEHLNLIQANGPIVDNRFSSAYQITDLAGRIEMGEIVIGALPSQAHNLLVVTPSAYTFSPVDTNGNNRYDKLVANVTVNVTDSGTFRAGNYRIEGLLMDDYGTEVAWAVSNPQAMALGTNTMTLEFDGEMLYDQLPLTGSRAFKLVAVKIFNGSLSSATLAAQEHVAASTSAYSRSQFEPSSQAITVFQDDLENGTDLWAISEDNVTGASTIYNVNIGYAVGGTFLLTVDSRTTAPLAWNISSTNLRTVLTDAGIATTSVTGSGTLAAPWVITFTAPPAAVTMDKTGLIKNVVGTGTVYNVNVSPAVGGTFLLTVDSRATSPLAWNISSTNLRTALTSAGIATTAVTGSGTSAAPWVITFTSAPATITIDKTGLIENVTGTGTIRNVNVSPAVGGTFMLTVDSITTAPLAWNISATNLRTALTNAGIATTAVTGSGTLATPWVITFSTAPSAVTIDKMGLIENLIGSTATYNVNIGSAIGGTFLLTVDFPDDCASGLEH